MEKSNNTAEQIKALSLRMEVMEQQVGNAVQVVTNQRDDWLRSFRHTGCCQRCRIHLAAGLSHYVSY